jgi:hypothetical protein
VVARVLFFTCGGLALSEESFLAFLCSVLLSILRSRWPLFSPSKGCLFRVGVAVLGA